MPRWEYWIRLELLEGSDLEIYGNVTPNLKVVYLNTPVFLSQVLFTPKHTVGRRLNKKFRLSRIGQTKGEKWKVSIQYQRNTLKVSNSNMIHFSLSLFI